ncbi:hypothetical protein LTR09_000730 [Extremus antarcticus]|uniref:AB hydrolase-1 domain-containing protein n=1 Tax=Extremus antarcticus TaxID=702011 RepID=A0AAJ0GK66_9PEZI|nr:hypothetical protein LTR09_000730 [Extremus antarcticus]
MNTIAVAGILCDVFGLDDLPSDCDEITCLWALHGRTLDRSWLHPSILETLHKHRERRTSERKGQQGGLIAVCFDQRNHGSRLVSPAANTDWLGGNKTAATDLFATYQGTATDVRVLIDFLPCYLPPEIGAKIRHHMVAGDSLGGHAAWQVVLQEPRVSAAVVFIGFPDFIRLMSWRAEAARLPSSSDGGQRFLGSEDFPPALVEAVSRYDPAASLLGKAVPLFTLQHTPGGVEEWSSDPDLMSASHLTAALAREMRHRLRNKSILNLYATRDPTVPPHASAPFLSWLSHATRPGAWFDGEGCRVENIGVDGVHALTAEMIALETQ